MSRFNERNPMIMRVLAGDEDLLLQPSYVWLHNTVYRCVTDLSATAAPDQWSVATDPTDACLSAQDITDWTPCGHPDVQTRH